MKFELLTVALFVTYLISLKVMYSLGKSEGYVEGWWACIDDLKYTLFDKEGRED